MNSFWRYCLSHFEKELPAQQFVTWIKPLKFHVEGDTLTLVAPNRFVLQWIRDKFYGRIQELAAEQLKRPVEIRLLLAEKETAPAVHSVRRRSAPAKGRPRDISRLNPAFTFDTFVTGKANELARAAATQVAERPGAAYNPLFIYGGVGLGQDASDPRDRQSSARASARKQDPLHPRRAIRLRRGARLSAQGFRRLQALLPFARSAADRRHPVLQRQEPHPGRVLLRLQRADRIAQAGRDHLRYLPERDLRAWRTG